MSMFTTHAVKQAAPAANRSFLKAGLSMAKKFVSHIARLRRRNSTYERLCDLDDRTLKDIGLCRSGLRFYKHHEAFHEMNEISEQSGNRERDE